MGRAQVTLHELFFRFLLTMIPTMSKLLIAGVITGFLLLLAQSAFAQETFPLWANGAPGALGKEDKDIPTLTVYLAKENSTAAIVVCPGGGYGGLAQHEGKDYALF